MKKIYFFFEKNQKKKNFFEKNQKKNFFRKKSKKCFFRKKIKKKNFSKKNQKMIFFSKKIKKYFHRRMGPKSIGDKAPLEERTQGSGNVGPKRPSLLYANVLTKVNYFDPIQKLLVSTHFWIMMESWIKMVPGTDRAQI